MEFNAIIRPSGNVFIISVPKRYIDDGHLKVGVTYRFSALVIENAEQ